MIPQSKDGKMIIFRLCVEYDYRYRQGHRLQCNIILKNPPQQAQCAVAQLHVYKYAMRCVYGSASHMPRSTAQCAIERTTEQWRPHLQILNPPKCNSRTTVL